MTPQGPASQVAGTAGDAINIALIGPIPPPIDGQSIVMGHMRSHLQHYFPNLKLADTSHRGTGHHRVLVAVQRSLLAWRTVRGADVVYIAVKADHGMWLTTVTALLARLSRARIFLHHHSYTYIRTRKVRMVALARIAGPAAFHIVLGHSMAADLRATVPEIEHTLIIGNAALVDQALMELPLRTDGDEMVLGHLSNLYLEKGIAEVVDLAAELFTRGAHIRLIVGGPVSDPAAQQHLNRARRLLGSCFEYRGPLAGESKREFFEQITHFIFPSSYTHESVPLVLYEAMAAGAVCVSTQCGAIREQLAGSPGLIARSRDSFVKDILPVLSSTSVSTHESQNSREAYLRALAQANDDLAQFISMIARR